MVTCAQGQGLANLADSCRRFSGQVLMELAFVFVPTLHVAVLKNEQVLETVLYCVCHVVMPDSCGLCRNNNISCQFNASLCVCPHAVIAINQDTARLLDIFQLLDDERVRPPISGCKYLKRSLRGASIGPETLLHQTGLDLIGIPRGVCSLARSTGRN